MAAIGMTSFRNLAMAAAALPAATVAGTSATIKLKPGDNVTEIVSRATKGERFVFTPGVYRLASLVPKDGQSFVGEDGAVLSGAVPINGWRRDGALWMTDGYPPPQFHPGEGRNGLAGYREDLVVNGEVYQRVGSRDALSDHNFYYERGRVWISKDPMAFETLALKAAAAFSGSASDVAISNLTIRFYASMAQHGAIDAHDSKGWTLTNLIVESNHAAGLEAGSSMTVQGGSYSHNGEVGIHAAGVSNLKIAAVTATGNNYAEFSAGWDAGGVKILRSQNIDLRDSVITQNIGSGLWFDWDNRDVTIRNNYVRGNALQGIQIEASSRTQVLGNVVQYNDTYGHAHGYWGAQILVQNSSGVEVSGNSIAAQSGPGVGLIDDARPPGAFGAHVTSDNVIAGNTVVMLAAGLNGFSASADRQIAFGGTNRMDANTYIAQGPKDLQFTWGDDWFTADEISGRPIEQTGRFVYTPHPEQFVKADFLEPSAATAKP